MFYKLILVSAVLTSSLTVNAAYSQCLKLFAKPVSNQATPAGPPLIIPRGLKVDKATFKRMLTMKGGALVRNIGELLIAISDPHIINQIRFSFREQFFHEDPFSVTLDFDRARFQKKFTEITQSTERLSEVELVAAYNRYIAIKDAIGTQILEPRQILLLSVLLRSEVTEKAFSPTLVVTELLLDSAELTSRFEHTAKLILANPRMRNVFNELLRDPGYQLAWSISDTLAPSRGSKYHSRLIERFNKRSVQLKPGERRSIDAVWLFLHHYLTGAAPVIGAEGPANRSLDRGNYIAKVEESLLSTLNNRNHVSEVTDYIDHVLFRTALPVPFNKLITAINETALNWLSPLRQQASDAIKAEVEALTPLVVPRAPGHTSPSLAVVPPAATQPQGGRGSSRPPKKRLLRQAATKAPLKSENAPAAAQKPNHPDLVKAKSIQADTIYGFTMKRQPELGIQKIRWNKDVFVEISKAKDANADMFVNSLVFGMASRSTSNGIKLLSIKGSKEPIYQVRSGESRYRLILKKEGDVWVASRFVTEDAMYRLMSAGTL